MKEIWIQWNGPYEYEISCFCTKLWEYLEYCLNRQPYFKHLQLCDFITMGLLIGAITKLQCLSGKLNCKLTLDPIHSQNVQ